MLAESDKKEEEEARKSGKQTTTLNISDEDGADDGSAAAEKPKEKPAAKKVEKKVDSKRVLAEKKEEDIPLDTEAIKAYSSVIADAAEDSEPSKPVVYTEIKEEQNLMPRAAHPPSRS